jgi:hypothetical protein
VVSTEVLGTYLNDHLGGANAGVEMAQQLHERAADGPDAATLAQLAADIALDRDELRELVERLGEGGHPAKKAAGWVAGKTQRLAVGELLTGDEHLSMLLQAETLALGIEGKRALWATLLTMESTYPELARADLLRLSARATDQRDRIETVRIAAAHRGLRVTTLSLGTST